MGNDEPGEGKEREEEREGESLLFYNVLDTFLCPGDWSMPTKGGGRCR